MTLTLLFDLDDTLLGNNIDIFLPAYLKALSKHLYAYVEPNLMVKELLAATQAMVTNNDPQLTLEQAFDQAFYPAIGRTKEELRAVLVEFYDRLFPELQSYTSRLPEAVQMIDDLRAHGHTIAIATNPLFPLQAILHRLVWAGLDPEQVPFDLITSYENFHFAKPNPAFYAEILAQLGWPEQPAVVIGNSIEDDLVPASRLGLPAYWVTEQNDPLPEEMHPASAKGPLSGVSAWVQKIDQMGLQIEYDSPACLLAVLKSIPAAVQVLIQSIHSTQWSERPSPEQWSFTEIICHLRDVDLEVNLPRIEKLTSEDNPFLPGINTDTWAQERDYQKEEGPACMQEFMAARTRLLERLERLPEEEWQCPARHAIFGPTTLCELVSFIATHDRSHISQIYETIQKKHASNIGL